MKKTNVEATPVSLRRRFFRPHTVVALALAVAFLVFIFTRFEVSLSDTWRQIRGSDPLYYVLGLAVYYASFPLRGLRWKILLRNAGLDREGKGLPSIAALTQMLLLNWFANVILYARVGDIYRPYLLKEERDIPYSASLGTVVAERVIDVLVVVGLLGVAALVLLGGSTANVALQFVMVGAGLVVLILAALALLWRFGGHLDRWMPARVRSAWWSFRKSTFSSFRQVPLPVVLSVAIWLMEAARLYFVALALDVHIALPFVFFVAMAYALLVAIPATPGGFGLVEPGMAGLLTLAIASASAWSVTFLDRSISFLSLIVVGLVIFGWREVKRVVAARRSSPPVRD
ncbi:MAG: lysylphosphatidylglycerol synthase transmembrane domain-containing protein [Chloroflexota bacterium]